MKKKNQQKLINFIVFTINHIKALVHNIHQSILWPWIRIKTVHHNLLSMTERDLQKSYNANIYQLFAQWLIDIFSIGVLGAIVYVTFMGWTTFGHFTLLTVSFGVIPTIIVAYRKAIKGESK